MMAFVSCEPMCLCRQLIPFSCMKALLQRLYICSSYLNCLSFVIQSSFTDLVISIILLSIFNEIVWLFLFCFCKTIAWNLSGLTIILFSLNHFTAIFDSFFNVIKRLTMLFDAAEIVLSSTKLCGCDFFSTVSKSLKNILNNIGPSIERWDTPISLKKYKNVINFHILFSPIQTGVYEGHCFFTKPVCM